MPWIPQFAFKWQHKPPQFVLGSNLEVQNEVVLEMAGCHAVIITERFRFR
jgi:hypothetical protein